MNSGYLKFSVHVVVVTSAYPRLVCLINKHCYILFFFFLVFVEMAIYVYCLGVKLFVYFFHFFWYLHILVSFGFQGVCKK